MKPSKLHKGDTIGIVSPARWLDKDILQKTIKILENAGYPVKVGSAAYLRENQYAGSTKNRVKELEAMFLDDEIKAIICSRGGYGAIRVADMLDYDIIKNNPKIFMGYSDITTLLISIYKMTGLTTFHGPMLLSFSKSPPGKETVDPFTWNYMVDVLSGHSPIEIKFPEDLPPSVLRNGVAEGELLGGNLTLLINMIGTPWDFDTAGKILFVEDLDEKLYGLDRMPLHLKRAGKLEHIAGLIVGEMVNIKDDEIPFGKTVDEIVLDVCDGMNFPIVSNFPCGHGLHQMTMPISTRARLECTDDSVTFTLLESPVQSG